MVCPSSHENVENLFYGMPPARTLWCHPIFQAPPKKQDLWLERKKFLKYSNLFSNYFFIPIAIETLGAFGVEADHFICDIGHRLKELTLSHFHLVQRISIAIQRVNALAVKGSMCCL